MFGTLYFEMENRRILKSIKSFSFILVISLKWFVEVENDFKLFIFLERLNKPHLQLLSLYFFLFQTSLRRWNIYYFKE